MEYRNQPAFPTDFNLQVGGLTRRDYFALQLMSGYLANARYWASEPGYVGSRHKENLQQAHGCVLLAEALIEALGTPQDYLDKLK